MNMQLWTWPALALALGYLLGSIPFGLLLTRMSGAGDLRQIGSGNIGATNVLRTGNKGLALATLLLDMAKGAGAVYIARTIDPGFALLGGAGAFFGHVYSVWLRFAGGKGVATLLGVCAALMWQVGLVFAVVWVGTFAVSRMSSVGGMSAAIAAPIAAFAFGDAPIGVLLLALALIVLWKHGENIGRLMAGTEPKFGQK
jgi:acyl phosphate:glycerol-3-phosphate acyltransferase